MSFFEPDSKRRKLLDDLQLTDHGLGTTDDANSKNIPMSYTDIMNVKYKSCFACENIHAKSIETNENYAGLMKLYTQNSANVCKDALYKKIYEYFQEHIVGDIVAVRRQMIEKGDIDELDSFPIPEWSIQGVREHFDVHTNYPSDELIFQTRLKRSVRNEVANNLIECRPDGTKSFNHKNMDIFIKLNKGIVELMKSKQDISKMTGYSPELDY